MTICANEADILLLEEKYAGRKPYYGDMHDHCADGLRKEDGSYFSDGKREIKDWLPACYGCAEDGFSDVSESQAGIPYVLAPVG